MSEQQTSDKTDGIVWQVTKPKLISRNYSTGNLQSLEKGLNESKGVSPAARPGGLAPVRERKRSLSSLLTGFDVSKMTQNAEKGPSTSFFKELVQQYDAKEAQEKTKD